MLPLYQHINQKSNDDDVGDCSGTHFYGHSPPSADSERAVVSY